MNPNNQSRRRRFLKETSTLYLPKSQLVRTKQPPMYQLKGQFAFALQPSKPKSRNSCSKNKPVKRPFATVISPIPKSQVKISPATRVKAPFKPAKPIRNLQKENQSFRLMSTQGKDSVKSYQSMKESQPWMFPSVQWRSTTLMKLFE